MPENAPGDERMHCALLDREHQIGHTYLFDVNDTEQLLRAFQNKVFPLLQEHFFDDWPKIRAVLCLA